MKRIVCLSLIAILAAAAAPVGAQVGEGKLRVFGHLNQGTGVSDDVPVHGIPTGTPTTDLRTLALQFRYAVGDVNEVVVQLKHQRLGISPIQEVADDVELHWAFYQHRVGSWRVRAGRAPIPLGLFNEVRDVGTVLPFFRVPHNLYPEGTDVVDGVVVSYQIGSPFGWHAEVDAFGGTTGYRNAFYTGIPEFPVFVLDMRTKRSVGGQLWVATPIQGLRVGAGVLDLQFQESDSDENGDRATVWTASVDGDFERVLLRSEVSYLDTPWFKTRTGMAQAGRWLTPTVGLFGQAEIAEFESIMPAPEVWRWSEDYALALNVRLSPDLLLKLEGHRVSGYGFEQWVDPSSAGTNSVYGIASLSVSF